MTNVPKSAPKIHLGGLTLTTHGSIQRKKDENDERTGRYSFNPLPLKIRQASPKTPTTAAPRSASPGRMPTPPASLPSSAARAAGSSSPEAIVAASPRRVRSSAMLDAEAVPASASASSQTDSPLATSSAHVYTRPDRNRLRLTEPQAVKSLQRYDGSTLPAAWAALPEHESWEAAYSATARYIDSRLDEAAQEDPDFHRKPVIICIAGPHGSLVNTASAAAAVDRLGERRGPLHPGTASLFIENDQLQGPIGQAIDHARATGTAISTFFDERMGGTPMSAHQAGIVNELGALRLMAGRSGLSIRYLEPSGASTRLEEGGKQEMLHIASVRRATRQGVRDAALVVGTNHLATMQNWFGSESTFIGIAPLGLDAPRMKEAISEHEGAQRTGYCIDRDDVLAFRSSGAVLSSADFEHFLRERGFVRQPAS